MSLRTLTHVNSSLPTNTVQQPFDIYTKLKLPWITINNRVDYFLLVKLKSLNHGATYLKTSKEMRVMTDLTLIGYRVKVWLKSCLSYACIVDFNFPLPKRKCNRYTSSSITSQISSDYWLRAKVSLQSSHIKQEIFINNEILTWRSDNYSNHRLENLMALILHSYLNIWAKGISDCTCCKRIRMS